MRAVVRYMVVGALILVAMLGIPAIFPSKGNPFNGKIADVASDEMPS